MKLSDNAVLWLEDLLRDRISGALSLRRAEGSAHDLELIWPGKPGHVRFHRDFSPASSGVVPVGCASLDLPSSSSRSSQALIAPLFDGPAPAPVFVIGVEGIAIHYDVLWLLYWTLNRLEEADSRHVDRFGRFPAVASFAYQNGYLERPVVDEWIAALASMCAGLWPGLPIRKSDFRIEPSHDVDFPSRYGYCSWRHFLRSIAQDLLRDRDAMAALNGLRIRLASYFSRRLSAADPFNTFEWLMGHSERRQLKSTFYFMAGGKDRLDPGYSPSHPAIRALMRSVAARGHSLGVHPSFGCMDDPRLLKSEVDAIRRIAAEEGIGQRQLGSRMHYYHLRYPETLRHMEQAGVEHDATMGYADRVGFRAGTCFSYRPFDALHDRPMAILIKPLVVMEGTLYSPGYMNLVDPDDCYRKVEQLAAACRGVGGVLSILWHNSEVATAEGRAMYTRMLDLTSQAPAAV